VSFGVTLSIRPRATAAPAGTGESSCHLRDIVFL
jgi:hypothetical protein